jgi:acyl carrier protein
MPTAEQVIAFTIKSLEEMNLDVEDVNSDSMIGPSGVDLDSLALAELVARLEDEFGASFPEDRVEQLAVLTLGEFAEMVAQRALEVQREGTPG